MLQSTWGGKIIAEEKMLFCQHGNWDVSDYNYYHWGHVKTILADRSFLLLEH